jgi:hypothetical protein
VYQCGLDRVPAFVAAYAPTDDELHALLQMLMARLTKLLTRRGALVEDMGQPYLAEPDGDADEAHTLRPRQAAAVTNRIGSGPRAGQKVVTRRSAMPREATERQALYAEINGFILHVSALVPRPRLHLMSSRGVLAPNAQLRPLLVLQGPSPQAHAATV